MKKSQNPSCLRLFACGYYFSVHTTKIISLPVCGLTFHGSAVVLLLLLVFGLLVPVTPLAASGAVSLSALCTAATAEPNCQ